MKFLFLTLSILSFYTAPAFSYTGCINKKADICTYSILGESGKNESGFHSKEDKRKFKQNMDSTCEDSGGTVTDWCQEEDFGEIYCVKTNRLIKIYYSSLDPRWRTKAFCETLGGEYQE